jgi:large repetitive protein
LLAVGGLHVGLVVADAIWLRQTGGPLMATGGTSVPGSASLAQAELQPVVAEAIARWVAAGLPTGLAAKLGAAKVEVADLSGSALGMAYADVIAIDRDAAGHGWFVDATPGKDEEFAPVREKVTATFCLKGPSGASHKRWLSPFPCVGGDMKAIDPRAADRIDLLSVVEHELGHIAGLDDLEQTAHDLMGGKLGVGIRRVAGSEEVDALFAIRGPADWM